MGSRARIGISSCLLGNEVRYDGRHSRSDIILESMGTLFELIPFCPEVAIGLSIPRPPINLVAVNGVVRVLGVSDPEHDVTDALKRYGLFVIEQSEPIHGYIFKSRSPSCGMTDVNVYDSKTHQVIDTSAGQFAKTIIQRHPQLPVEDEVGLSDETIRNDFIQRVLSYSQKTNI